MNRSLTAAGLVLMGFLVWQPAAAQPTDELLRALQREVETLKQGQGALQRDLEEIKRLLRARQVPAQPAPDDQPRNLRLSLDDSPAKGDASARLVLVDFTDYQ